MLATTAAGYVDYSAMGQQQHGATPLAVRLLLLALVALVSALTVMAAFGAAPAAFDLTYSVVEFGAAACCLMRAWALSAERASWTLIGAGMLSFAVGDVYFVYVLTPAGEIPYPSWADVGFLGFYPLAYVGLVLLLKARMRRLSAGAWVDALVGALAVASVGAALAFDVVLSETDGPITTVATNLAYPLSDLVLAALAFGVIVLTGRTSTWALLAGGLTIFAVTDTLFLYQTAEGTYVNQGLLDVGWPLALLTIAVAAWRPSRSGETRAPGWSALAVPVLAGVSSIALQTYDHFARINDVALLLSSATVLALLLRLVISFRDNLRALADSREQASKDALTGLGNRRALAADLDDSLRNAEREPVALGVLDLDGFKTYNDTFGHAAGDALLTRVAARLAEVAPGKAYRLGGDEFCVLVDADLADAVLERAAQALSERGAAFEVGCSVGTVQLPFEAAKADEALRIADERMYAAKGAGRVSAARQTSQALVRALVERNTDLADHAGQVATLSVGTGEALGLCAAEIDRLRYVAELHDIGTVAMPDGLLGKRGPLDDAEWQLMRQHTLIGERILVAAPDLALIGRLVRSTHEAYDGSGYPDGLVGSAIPIEARVVAVCDAYDAMTTDRSYGHARPHAEAIAELRRCAGQQFDPAVVGAFCRQANERSRVSAERAYPVSSGAGEL